MKEELMAVLACPLCKGDLRLMITEKRDSEVWTGSLSCGTCQQTYPISEGIPNLLPPELEIDDKGINK